MEICISTEQNLIILNANGTEKWRTSIDDNSSRQCGTSIFDFNVDGIMEILHNDHGYFRIFNGNDGSIIYEYYVESRTYNEFPIVADVDNDNGSIPRYLNNNWELYNNCRQNMDYKGN